MRMFFTTCLSMVFSCVKDCTRGITKGFSAQQSLGGEGHANREASGAAEG